MKREVGFAAIVIAVVSLAASARAEGEHWPAAAEQRFQEALALSMGKPPRHREAAAAYRSVAEWPEGGPFRERAQALNASAQELELAGDLEAALATYREIEKRFPDDPFAGIARRSAERLDPPGVAGGLEFRRRHDEALAVLLPALALVERRELSRARPDLERALELLRAIHRDFPQHPRVVDVTVGISDVLVRLERLDEARSVAEEALRLADERAAATPSTITKADVVSAQRQLDEARRAIRLQRVSRAAGVILVTLAVALVALRPWRRVNRSVLKLAGALAVLDAVFAAVGAFGAEYVRRRYAPSSPIENGMAALLVFVPGAVGMTYAVGFAISIRGRSAPFLAALAGLAGALATTTCLVQHYGFFDFLPDL